MTSGCSDIPKQKLTVFKFYPDKIFKWEKGSNTDKFRYMELYEMWPF